MHRIGHGEWLALKDPAGYCKAQRHITKMNQFHSAPKKDASSVGGRVRTLMKHTLATTHRRVNGPKVPLLGTQVTHYGR
jgi:hypothetical protein